MLLRSTANRTRHGALSAARVRWTSTAAADVSDARAARRAARADKPQAVAIEGTTPFYTRQLVVVDPEDDAPRRWPKKLEQSNHVIAAYAKALEPHGGAKESPLKAIAATPFLSTAGRCRSDESQEPAELSERHDLLVFPDLLRVSNVQLSQVDSIVSDLMQADADAAVVFKRHELDVKPLDDGVHILVCAHDQRDFRCGCNGPKLLEWLRDEGDAQGVSVHLYSSSHFGGHRYAANCITYPGGDWFGLINAREDAAELLRAVNEDAPLRLHDRWRGRVALTKEQQLQAVQQVLADAAMQSV
ncbi:hypothetical protein P43SY_010136 [Pythium insidiosum]|uniref:Uncharacterized protein n=1 Tax=Pythium insidiosum TaxID=114742 RepID=A0AAD5Q863_PYTIN|nr:hypothetical protein P43SY_010136 [Pythium insidiosum]